MKRFAAISVILGMGLVIQGCAVYPSGGVAYTGYAPAYGSSYSYGPAYGHPAYGYNSYGYYGGYWPSLSFSYYGGYPYRSYNYYSYSPYHSYNWAGHHGWQGGHGWGGHDRHGYSVTRQSDSLPGDPPRLRRIAVSWRETALELNLLPHSASMHAFPGLLDCFRWPHKISSKNNCDPCLIPYKLKGKDKLALLECD